VLKRNRRTIKRDDEGSATAELAMTFPALLLIVALLLSVFSAVSLRLRCGELANSIAHAVIRGESELFWRPLVEASLPGAKVIVTSDGALRSIEVSVPGPSLLPITLTAHVIAPG
jgi:hypothetical protein